MKKLGTHDTPNTKYGRKREKNPKNSIFEGFLGCRNVSKKSTFWVNFFREALENFLCIQNWCCRYLQGVPNIALYAGKKIRNTRHTNHKIRTETWKKTQKMFLPWAALYIWGIWYLTFVFEIDFKGFKPYFCAEYSDDFLVKKIEFFKIFDFRILLQM